MTFIEECTLRGSLDLIRISCEISDVPEVENIQIPIVAIAGDAVDLPIVNLEDAW